MKLKNEEELTKELLQTFAYPGDHEERRLRGLGGQRACLCVCVRARQK